MDTYTDDNGDPRCDDCEQLLEDCVCICDTCGDNIHECACD